MAPPFLLEVPNQKKGYALADSVLGELLQVVAGGGTSIYSRTVAPRNALKHLPKGGSSRPKLNQNIPHGAGSSVE